MTKCFIAALLPATSKKTYYECMVCVCLSLVYQRSKTTEIAEVISDLEIYGHYHLEKNEISMKKIPRVLNFSYR